MVMDRIDKIQTRRWISMFANTAILLIVCGIFAVFWNYFYGNQLWLEGFWDKGNKLIVVLYGIFFCIFMYVYGGYKFGTLRRANLILSQFFAVFFTNALMFLQMILLWRHIYCVKEMLLMSLLDVLGAAVISLICETISRKVFPPRELLLLYGEYSPEMLKRKFGQREDKYIIIHSIRANLPDEELFAKILEYGKSGVVLADLHAGQRNRILKYCYAHGIRTYLTPKISDIVIHNSEMLHVFDTPLFVAKAEEMPLEQKLLKRILDVMVSLVILILASPIMVIAALCIHFYDGGPVFFKQKRLTLNGKEFYVYKFRSMIVDAEKDGVARLATEHDSRITPVGKLIRATRVDELPQLLNILKGDMSVVGPRPERPEIASEYEKDIPEFAFRLKAKAGLTGYAQIYGKYNTTAYDKLKLDLMYIESWSLLLDIKLILETVKIVFMKDSTEGLEEGETISLTQKKEEEENA